MPHKGNAGAGDDEQLIAAALGGDARSFGRIVEKYWETAVALALSRTDDAVEAEDIAQESFTKAYMELSRLRRPSRFLNWLSTIIAQQSADARRKRARGRIALECETGSLERSAGAVACYSNPELPAEQAKFVREAVRHLPEKMQKVVIMRFVGGLSTIEIAKQLGKRKGTVRVWLHRAYNTLRAELGPLLEDAES
jgi:RNA polymerase sigma-70 factor (ECF subfamily)